MFLVWSLLLTLGETVFFFLFLSFLQQSWCYYYAVLFRIVQSSNSGSMDLNFIEKVQNIALTKEEGEEIKEGGTHKNKTLEECSLSLLGRFLTSSPYNQTVAKSLLRSVWKMGFDMRIVDVGEG